ncbi:MAG: HEAT repeat domain-containing protein [bacterium]
MNSKRSVLALCGLTAWMVVAAGCSDKTADNPLTEQPVGENPATDPLQVRPRPVATAGASKSQQAVQPLIATLSVDAKKPAAHEALIQIGNPAVQPLIEALTNPNAARAEIAQTLGEIGDVRALGPLTQLLAEEEIKAHDGDLREQEQRKEVIIAARRAVDAIKSKSPAPAPAPMASRSKHQTGKR